MLDLALSRQHSAPPVHQLAAQRAEVQSPGHPIAEADQDAFLQSLVLHLVGPDIEAFVFRDAQKLIKQRAHLFCGDRMYAQLATGIQSELVIKGITPCAHQYPEVGRRLFSQ